MTDKATVEVTAPFSGRVIERTGVPGDMLPVGGVILVFENEDGDGDIPGSGPEQTVSVSSPALASADHPAPILHTGTVEPAPDTERRVLASPAVRKYALDRGVDLRDVVGSAAGGRIRRSDVDAYLTYMKRTSQPRTAQPQPAAMVLPAPFSPAADGVDEVPVIGLRRRIAERMQDTKRRIPHFSYIEEVDVSQLETLRERLNATRAENRPKLTLLPFIVRALTRVLPEFPHLNALYDDVADIVRRHSAVHAGIATQTPQGLVVTVLRDAARRDIWGIASELSRLSGLARAGRAAPSDLTGSTITITSLRAMGGVATTPVINSPEVAIVGVNKVIERPMVIDGQIRIAKMMNLSSSFDHRVVDGRDAALFVQRLKALLEIPTLLFVDP